jgi:hypothetical protein
MQLRTCTFSDAIQMLFNHVLLNSAGSVSFLHSAGLFVSQFQSPVEHPHSCDKHYPFPREYCNCGVCVDLCVWTVWAVSSMALDNILHESSRDGSTFPADDGPLLSHLRKQVPHICDKSLPYSIYPHIYSEMPYLCITCIHHGTRQVQYNTIWYGNRITSGEKTLLSVKITR